MTPDDPRPLEPFERPFPSLPVIQPGQHPRSAREKYGSLLYLGVGGLILVVALVAWFTWGVWTLRHVLEDVYVLHDAARAEEDRVNAAYRLARDPGVNQRQLWDIALRKPLPPVARYVVAESLTAEAVETDPRGYVLSVARSEGWPPWLRALLARPIAYAAENGVTIPAEPLEELAGYPDPYVALWARYALAVAGPGRAEAATTFGAGAGGLGGESAFRKALAAALAARPGPDRLLALDSATEGLRVESPEAARVWDGWRREGGRLVRRTAPKLH